MRTVKARRPWGTRCCGTPMHMLGMPGSKIDWAASASVKTLRLSSRNGPQWFHCSRRASTAVQKSCGMAQKLQKSKNRPSSPGANPRDNDYIRSSASLHGQQSAYCAKIGSTVTYDLWHSSQSICSSGSNDCSPNLAYKQKRLLSIPLLPVIHGQVAAKSMLGSSGKQLRKQFVKHILHSTVA